VRYRSRSQAIRSAWDRSSETLLTFALREVERVISDQSRTNRETINQLWDILDDPHVNNALGLPQNYDDVLFFQYLIPPFSHSEVRLSVNSLPYGEKCRQFSGGETAASTVPKIESHQTKLKSSNAASPSVSRLFTMAKNDPNSAGCKHSRLAPD